VSRPGSWVLLRRERGKLVQNALEHRIIQNQEEPRHSGGKAVGRRTKNAFASIKKAAKCLVPGGENREKFTRGTKEAKDHLKNIPLILKGEQKSSLDRSGQK